MSGSEGAGIFSWVRKQYLTGRELFRDFRERVLHEQSAYIMGALALIVFALALIVWLVERHSGPPDNRASGINSLGRAVYWMFISGATTGYGDIIPHTDLGRGLTVLIIMCSMALTSIITATRLRKTNQDVKKLTTVLTIALRRPRKP